MAANLQNQIQQLHSAVTSGSLGNNADVIHSIIGDLGHTCLQDINHKEIDFACSLLFAKDNGLLSSIRKVALLDQFLDAKHLTLEILHSFINKVEKKILPYAVDIKDACLSLFRDRASKVKNAVFPVLIRLLELTAGSNIGKELDIAKLVEKFFMELSGKTKHTSTVKMGIFALLGMFAQVFPEDMINYHEKLLEIYMRALKTEMTSSKKPDMPIITGCFRGLTSLLVNFTQSVDEGSKYSYDIFNYTRKAINPQIQITKYDVIRAGLTLFSMHGAQFNTYMIDSYEGLYEQLTFWATHNNRDVAHVGMNALDSFLRQISDMLVSQAEEGKKDGATFQFFIQQFCDIMKNKDSSSKKVSLAIRGYGYFAAPCKLFLTNDDVKFMFTEMIQRSEQLFFSQPENLDDKIINLPSFVEALACIVRQLDQMTETFLASLEKLVVMLIEYYPKFGQKLGFICVKAILQVLLSLFPKGAAFRNLLSRVIYQGLIRICSHPVVANTDNQQTEDDEREKKISYKDYVNLWLSLLDVQKLKDSGHGHGMNATYKKQLEQAIYDETISSVSRILDKLDLNSKKSDRTATDAESDSPATSDPIKDLQASKPKDFQIFINLVDFCRDVLPVRHYYHFSVWVYKFGHQLIVHSTKYPLVSGFYKLLATCLTICTKMHYFKGVNKTTEEERSNLMDTDDNEDCKTGPSNSAEKVAAFVLFSKFAKEVLARMKQYKDDLLAACLLYILALPVEIVSVEISQIVPALETAFEIGLSYLPLAAAGLDALERWSNRLPSAVMKPYYKSILPRLDCYLSSPMDDDKDAVTIIATPMSKRGKRKVPIKLLESTQTSSEIQLIQIKKRIVVLLGSIGGCNNKWLIDTSADDVASLAVAWDTEKHLRFDVPFMDMKPTIYFDDFLPRIVNLATQSSDRQTKVAACELLHSLILYTLGRSVQQPGQGHGPAKYSMEKLYQRLFPVVLKLSCDVELVAKQLFEPLMMQLIHWFTNNKKFESDDTNALLKAILAGVVHPTDSALRDFSAKCVKEFLKWSIKQTTKKMQEKSPINTKSLLKQLYSLALHPSPFKRYGAALAFNNIYDIFREEEALLDQFTFEILANYVDSLAIAHADDKSLGTQDQCKEALDHLDKILRKRAAIFMKPSSQRRLPREWSKATLDVCIRWLMRQCGRPQTECRHSCMKLVCNLATCIPGIKDVPSLFKNLLNSADGADYFLIRFEAGTYMSNGEHAGLAKYPTMTEIDSVFSIKIAVRWFELLLTCLDCYTWVFGEGLLKPADIFLAKNGKKCSILFKSLEYFLNEIACQNIEYVAGCFSVKSGREVFTPREVDHFNRSKCTVLVRLMNFLTIVFGRYPSDGVKVLPPSLLSNDNLWRILCCCVTDPVAIGFNMADVEVIMRLPQEVEQLMLVFRKRLPQNALHQLQAQLRDKLQQLSLPVKLSSGESYDHVQFIHLVTGYEILFKTDFLTSLLPASQSVPKLALELLNNVFKRLTRVESGDYYIADLSPTTTDLADKLLNLSLLIGVDVDSLVKLIVDRTVLKNVEGNVACYYGSLFYTTFKATINSFVVSRADRVLTRLLKCVDTDANLVAAVVTSVLDQIGKDRQLRKTEGVALVGALLGRWNDLKSWWMNPKDNELLVAVINIFNKVLLIDSSVTKDVNHPAHECVLNMYCHLLSDNKTTLVFKGQVLDLLFFFSELPDIETTKLRQSLDCLVTDCFPLRSTEFDVGSPKHDEYVTAMRKLLYAFKLSGSLMLLELLISVMCREPKHIMEDEIQSSLIKFITRMPLARQVAAVDVPYDVFKMVDRYPDDIRRAALERVCIPLLRQVHVGAITQFFQGQIKDIGQTIMRVKLSKSSESTLKSQLISKICCFQLVEILYSRLTKDGVNSANSVVNQAYCGQTNVAGNELTKDLTKASLESRREDIRDESMLLELRRQFHCAAHNALIAIVSCTQTNEKFFNAFLFTENLAKGEFLLDNLVDKQKTYVFETELNAPLARKKKFVSIRQEARENRAETDEDSVSSIHYMASQYLADSSLSEEVSQFDRLSSMQSVSEADVSSRRKALQQRESNQDDLLTITDYVEMEMDELNAHECMATLSAVIQHLHRLSPIAKGEAVSSLPPWMNYLKSKLTNSTTHLNIKLFITRLMVNCEQVFRPYAKYWLGPLVQFIVCGDNGGEGIHYFIVDLVVMMLSWVTVAIPEDTITDRAMATSLVEFLMRNCHHPTLAILKNNLEMLKTLVECWKSRIDIPVKVIFDNFSAPEPKNKSNATGIQILGVVLANKLPPYQQTSTIDRDRYFFTLAQNMMKDYKLVYAAAAEVVGMVLRYMQDEEQCTESDFHDHVYKVLGTLQGGKLDVFITCIHKIQLQFPAIIDRFVNQLLFVLPNLHGQFKLLCLEIILARTEFIDDIFMEMRNKGIVDLLNHRDEGIQHVSLKIVQAMLKKLPAADLLFLLPCVTGFSRNPSQLCRATMYEILIWIYDNYREDESDSAADVMSQVKECLLHGLSDDDLHNKLLVQNFWSHETRLPTSTFDRMVAMLEAMHSPATESQYLSYATNLLLEMTSKSPDYNREIFEHPLSECRFEDYNVHSSWRQRHATMTPLFVETQASQPGSSQSSLDDSMAEGGVRATQDVNQFTQTQAAGSKAPYNWLTQSSLDTFADQSLFAGTQQTTETQSALMFRVGKPPKTQQSRKYMKPIRPSFGRIQDQNGQNKDGSGDAGDDVELLRLRRRFLKNKASEQNYFARKQARLKETREKMIRERKVRRENQVTMYRKYRIGDLPDVQIKHSYIIAPLQALAQKDGVLAKILFSAIFKGIFAEIENVKTEREAAETVECINKYLNDMLANSTQYSPHFIGCIQDIVYSLPRKLKLDLMIVETASVASMQQPLGILLLEEQILVGEDNEPSAPKSRKLTSKTISRETSVWIELARLYKSLDDYDALRGIFGGLIDTKQITHDALTAEAKGDFLLASSLYEEAMKCTAWSDGEPSVFEVDFWDESRLECLNNLTKWTKIEYLSVSAVNEADPSLPSSLNNIWEDPSLQENYLPYIMRAKQKLLLKGVDQGGLLSFIDDSMKTTERKAILEAQYSEELALIYMWQGDLDRAKYYTDNAVKVLLQEWSNIDQLMLMSRTKKLQGVQQLIELEEFLELATNESDRISVDKGRNLVEKWLPRKPDESSPSGIWEDITTNRFFYCEQLREIHSSAPSLNWRKAQVLMSLSQVHHAQLTRNFSVGRKILKLIQEQSYRCGLKVVWLHSSADLYTKIAIAKQTSPLNEKLGGPLQFYQQLVKCEEEELLESNLCRRNNHALIGEIISLVTREYVASDESLQLDDQIAKNIMHISNCTTTLDKNKIVAGLIEKASDHYSKACQQADEAVADDYSNINKAHMGFVKFIDWYLRINDDDNDDEDGISKPLNEDQSRNLAENMVVSLLSAMKHNSQEARQYFPRLLQIIAEFPQLIELFIEKSKSVPRWMFISWISQMVALLDKKESLAVHDILLTVCEEYPQAVIYPFKICSENFTFEGHENDKMSQATIKKLEAMLGQVPHVNTFISALEQFGQPEALFKDWIDEMMKLMRDPSSKKTTGRQKIIDEFRAMYGQLMDYKQSLSTESSSQSLYSSQSNYVETMGPYRKRFGAKYAEDIDKLFGKDGSKLMQLSPQAFQKNISSLFASMRDERTLKPPSTLKEYSPWMAEFKATNLDKDLEIPGQYDGRSKPLPEYHTKISGFDSEVLVMSSLRKPKRIQIRGNDEKDYRFLVKGGEDLRQDQRIEQLFEIMNEIYSRDWLCSKRKLQLKTYQVIPMTARVGLIEWVKNTKPLFDFLQGAMTEQEKKFYKSGQGPSTCYVNWISRFAGPKASQKDAYEAMYYKANKKETVRNFEEQANKVPWDLLRRGFRRMSSSPEAFFTLRSHFITSHAMICVSQYILGIGDRHLSNYMIDEATGGMVGIDFGHAFGTATQFLEIPELMPFRLTRQILNLMLPMKEKGLFECTMIHSLQALRNDHDLLLSTMDIFIKDQSLDMIQFAERQMNTGVQGLDIDTSDSAWYPKQKVLFARRKLEGANPGYITRDEIKLGHARKKKNIEKFYSVALGDESNVRRRCEESKLSVEDQVACLIDQATDSNILGRTYRGWAPFM
ncbi:DNA-dependent protein kinase catalytic subunit-like [Tubulanus polymorphus]|uniref:DNA-dependent protein kinase catalytic subunit-like n=1 Tax=Tubulanus polymorphus TaxID=672921 RepID=UPI003DA2CEC7